MGWRPIESAPKDGAVPFILGFYDGDGHWETHIGRYCEPLSTWCDDDNGDCYSVTHWMPMPPAPQAMK